MAYSCSASSVVVPNGDARWFASAFGHAAKLPRARSCTFEPMNGKTSRNRGDNDGMVYSTNPGYSWDDEVSADVKWSVEHCATLYVSLDRKQRAGKPVTLVEGFDGPATELLLLGKALKQQCGVGGAVKEGCILVQGDHRDKVVAHLGSLGYSQTKRRMNLYLKTLAGLEPLAADELKAAGATAIEPGRRGISFEGDAKVLYTICMHSRFAVRVLRHLTSFEAATPDDLYRNGARFAWENILSPEGTFVIDATVHSDGFSHSHFAALKLKDAIVDRFRGKTGKRPSIDKVRPDLRLNLHISGEKVTICVDAEAQLSRRGPSPHRQGAPE